MSVAMELVEGNPSQQDMVMHPPYPDVVESLGKLEERFEALLKVLVESQVNTQLQLSQIIRNTSSPSKHDEEVHKAVSNPSSSFSMNPLYQPEEEGGREMKEEYIAEYKRLYLAAVDGDWKSASKFLMKKPDAITKVIASDSRTVLHVAIGNMAELNFVDEIVKLMPQEILEYKTIVDGYTALHLAASRGYTKAAEMIVNKNSRLTQITCGHGRVPLLVAVKSDTVGQRETVEYLYSVTRHEHPSPFAGEHGVDLLCCTIDAGFHAIAVSLVQQFQELVIDEEKNVSSTLKCMVERPFAFKSGAKLTFWQHYIYPFIEVDMEAICNPSVSWEDSSIDEENPVERSEEVPTSVGNNQSKNLESTAEDTLVKPSKIKTVIKPVTVIINFFLAFLSFVIALSPVPRIVESCKQTYCEKVRHKQAKYLVKCMLIPLEENMNKAEIIEFFQRSNLMKIAMKHGTTEFLKECLQLFPYLIWHPMDGQLNESMMQMAISERNKKIMNLICKTAGDEKLAQLCISDNKNNTILHSVAKLAPFVQLNLVSGAYLQMQRELQWFKGVESMLPEKYRFKKNINGETAQDIFTKEHKELKDKGEEWLKNTSGSCMVVAALISTVTFAATVTVPGGTISDSNSTKNGTPVFLGKTSFTIFVAANALALITSITSVFTFLAIYTSRFAEDDFLKSLPTKMMIGLITIVYSMETVLIAFCASLYIVIGGRFRWIPIPLVLLCCVPLESFIWYQLPFLWDMVCTTHRGNMFQKHKYVSSLRQVTKKEN